MAASKKERQAKKKLSRQLEEIRKQEKAEQTTLAQAKVLPKSDVEWQRAYAVYEKLYAKQSKDYSMSAKLDYRTFKNLYLIEFSEAPGSVVSYIVKGQRNVLSKRQNELIQDNLEKVLARNPEAADALKKFLNDRGYNQAKGDRFMKLYGKEFIDYANKLIPKDLPMLFEY